MIAEGSVEEGFKRQAGHLALDALGLIPGPGEAADLANALWYAKEGEYLNSAFSLISMIPEVGDLVGKGAKNLKRLGGAGNKILQKIEPYFIRFWPSLLATIEKISEWKPYIKELDAAVSKMWDKAGEDFNDGTDDIDWSELFSFLPSDTPRGAYNASTGMTAPSMS
tara:strand:- start:1108 stop:1608 length:501 start_codon:yes stop_codon:yes gene_type:complete